MNVYICHTRIRPWMCSFSSTILRQFSSPHDSKSPMVRGPAAVKQSTHDATHKGRRSRLYATARHPALPRVTERTPYSSQHICRPRPRQINSRTEILPWVEDLAAPPKSATFCLQHQPWPSLRSLLSRRPLREGFFPPRLSLAH